MTPKIGGVGVSFRPPHFDDIMATNPDLGLVEILADNFLDQSAQEIRRLHELGERYPLVLHCVGFNLVSPDPLDENYLSAIAGLAQELQPAWVTDHLCWVRLGNRAHHDLLPFPRTNACVSNVVDRISRIQDVLDLPFGVENISAYVDFTNHDMNEAEFLKILSRTTGCGVLLDLNNLYVNQQNLGWSVQQYLDEIRDVWCLQVHLAGFEASDGVLIDTHGSEVSADVWRVYQQFCRQRPGVPAVIEWDKNLPSWSIVQRQVEIARRYYT